MFFQTTFQFPVFKRGFHLVTNFIENKIPELAKIKIGFVQIFLQHTSASLTINENADQTVRIDFENHFNKLIPENENHYTHTFEGSDDIPAHLKTSVLGSSLTIPITNGKLNLGIWQGIYLCEHRNFAGKRTVVVTIFGE
ncbi:YjbQ family protein [bacterium]|nr:YjbQ family protein [bacterium]